jgi:hypothetical protein
MSSLSKLARERRLNIIDDLKNHHREPRKREVESLVADARGAHRFILGDEASFAVGRWIGACGDLLLDNLQFAKPPFEKTYIELSIVELNDGIGAPTAGPRDQSDDRIGFLIDGDRVRTVVSGPSYPTVGMGVWTYRLNTPDAGRFMDGPVEREEWLRTTLLLGSTTGALKDEAQLAAITRGTVIRSTAPPKIMEERIKGPKGQVWTRAVEFVRCAAGEMRTLWAVLLLINQHRHRLGFANMPREVAITPRGRRVFAAHTLVSVPLHAPEATRRFYYPSLRASPIGHEVRGCWVHLHLRPGCTHEWPTIPDEHNHFVCARCQGFRTWRKPHVRGHTEIGINLHTYEVTP